MVSTRYASIRSRRRSSSASSTALTRSSGIPTRRSSAIMRARSAWDRR
ncbi:hypothetical protein ACFOLD_09555 [Kocuria carniphila]